MTRSLKLEIAMERISKLQKAHGGAFLLGLAYFSGELTSKEERKFKTALRIVPPTMYATF